MPAEVGALGDPALGPTLLVAIRAIYEDEGGDVAAAAAPELPAASDP